MNRTSPLAGSTPSQLQPSTSQSNFPTNGTKTTSLSQSQQPSLPPPPASSFNNVNFGQQPSPMSSGMLQQQQSQQSQQTLNQILAHNKMQTQPQQPVSKQMSPQQPPKPSPPQLETKYISNEMQAGPVVTQQLYTPDEIRQFQEQQRMQNPDLQNAINIQTQFQTLMNGQNDALNDEMLIGNEGGVVNADDSDNVMSSNVKATTIGNKLKLGAATGMSAASTGVKKYIYPTIIFILLFASFILVLISQMSVGSKIVIAIAMLIIFIMYYLQIKSWMKTATPSTGTDQKQSNVAQKTQQAGSKLDVNENVKRTAPGGNGGGLFGKLFKKIIDNI